MNTTIQNVSMFGLTHSFLNGWFGNGIADTAKGSAKIFDNVVCMGNYGINTPTANGEPGLAYMFNPYEFSGNVIRKNPARGLVISSPNNKLLSEADFDASVGPDFTVKPGSKIATSVTTKNGALPGADVATIVEALADPL